jgi:primosomal protein N' (replication factor Y)
LNELLDHTMDEVNALYVEVVLPLPVRKLFTYRLPAEFFELAVQGKRVFVPFGNRKVYTGIIVNITTQAPLSYEALYIISVLDDNPLITSAQLKFWQWVADYYMCGLGDVMAAALPAGLKLASESYIALQEDISYEASELDERELLILKALEGKEKVRISEIESLLKSRTSYVKIVKSLYERNLIVMFEDVSEKYKVKRVSRIRLNPALSETEIEAHVNLLEKKAKSQFQAFIALVAEPGQDGVKADLIRKYNLQAAAIKALIDKGLLLQYEVDTERFTKISREKESFELSGPQKRALLEVEDAFVSKQVVLLFGATASGKTFIYIELIRQQLELGKSVMYLVPEIALTEQLVRRLELYFGDVMMVSHSRFSMNEKVEIWNKAARGEIRLLVGPRSTLFMPLQDLGLVIIDEEHESTFKQMEKAPRYHGRDAAVVLAGMQGAKVLLGSGTPSVESFYNAQAGKYGFVELPEMYGLAQKAEIIFGDIKEDTKAKKMKGIFTEGLVLRLRKLQEEKAQAILFQNRKGYVPILECSVCGWVSKCINCDIAMTYYKYSNNLRCHYCGYQQANITKCQACGSHAMAIQGYGTERITEELQLLMPELRVIRFDQDSTRQKNAFRRLINDFESMKADVMVGTQIAVKGLDFEHVQLTSVINADHLLNFPDFRAYERTFQLLVQLAGRAGRHGHPGTMVIQTRQPEHELLKAVQNYDYKGMYAQQITEREQFSYSPFSKMIRLTLKHKSPEEINICAARFSSLLKKQLGARVLGPETPFVSRIRNLHLRNLLIKLDAEKDNPKAVKSFISKTFDYMVQEDNIKGLTLVNDVDCY